jgi:hypothetical protein
MLKVDRKGDKCLVVWRTPCICCEIELAIVFLVCNLVKFITACIDSDKPSTFQQRDYGSVQRQDGHHVRWSSVKVCSMLDGLSSLTRETPCP